MAATSARADTITPRVGLTQPTTSFGDIWGVKMNNNFALIDASIAGQSVSNIFTSTNAFAGAVYFPFMSPGSCFSVDSTGLLIGQSCGGGGGGSSTLANYVNNVLISSPTAAQRFSGNFQGSLVGGATLQLDINPNTTYFAQTNGIFQNVPINVATATVRSMTISTATISSGTYTNATISGPTLAYSSGTFLNSVAIGTTNVNGQPFRILDTNGSGVGSFESLGATPIQWNLKNSAGSFTMIEVGTGGDSGTGAASGDGLMRSLNNMYLSAGGPTVPAGVKITPTGGVFVSTLTISTLPANQCVQTTTGGKLTTTGGTCAAGGGGGGASSLALALGSASAVSTIVSSPTAIGNFNSLRFNVSLEGSATGYIDLLSSQTFTSVSANFFNVPVVNSTGTLILNYKGGSGANALTFTSASSGFNGYTQIDAGVNSLQFRAGSNSGSIRLGSNAEFYAAATGWTIENLANTTQDVGLSITNDNGDTPRRFINFQGIEGSAANDGDLWFQPSQLYFGIDRALNVYGNTVIGSTQALQSGAFTYAQSSQFQVISSTQNIFEVRFATSPTGYNFAVSTQGEVGLSNSYGTSGQVATSQGPGLPAIWQTVSSGGGGGGSSVVVAPQFSWPYYNVAGSSNSLSAFPGVTMSTNTGISVSTMSVSSLTVTAESLPGNLFVQNIKNYPGLAGPNLFSSGGQEIGLSNQIVSINHNLYVLGNEGVNCLHGSAQTTGGDICGGMTVGYDDLTQPIISTNSFQVKGSITAGKNVNINGVSYNWPTTVGASGGLFSVDSSSNVTLVASGGGGGVSGQIVVGALNSIPRYSVTGSSNVVSAAANFTNDGNTVTINQTGNTATAFVVTSTGTGNGFNLKCNGLSGGALSTTTSGCFNMGFPTSATVLSDGFVIDYSSAVDPQNGVRAMHFIMGPLWNDPVILIEKLGDNSSPGVQIRAPGQAGIELIDTFLSQNLTQPAGKYKIVTRDGTDAVTIGGRDSSNSSFQPLMDFYREGSTASWSASGDANIVIHSTAAFGWTSYAPEGGGSHAWLLRPNPTMSATVVTTLPAGIGAANQAWVADGSSNLNYVTVVRGDGVLQANTTGYISSMTVTGQMTVGTLQGANLATCGDATHALAWSGGTFSCQAITGTGGGGGGTSGQVNNGTSPNMSYYSVAGSSNVLSAVTFANVWASSVTFSGAGGIGVTYGITASSVSASSITVAGPMVAASYALGSGVGVNTGVIFQNGQAYATSSAFEWNGSTLAATNVNVPGAFGIHATYSVVAATFTSTALASSGNICSSNGLLTTSGCANGTLTANQTITLSGDSTGSGTTAITVTNAALQPNITTMSASSVTFTGATGIQINANKMFDSSGTRWIYNTGSGANFFAGDGAGTTSGSGTSNTGVGQNSLGSLTTALQDTCVGNGCGISIQTGSSSSFFGFNSGGNRTNAVNETGIGVATLQSNTGGNNFAGGANAGIYATSVDSSVFMGSGSGGTGVVGSTKTVSGAYLMMLGYGTSVGTTNVLTNAIAMGQSAVVSASNTIVIGGAPNSATTMNLIVTTVTATAIKWSDGSTSTSAATSGGGGSGITALTGDVTASGTGSVAATLATNQTGAHTWSNTQTVTAPGGIVNSFGMSTSSMTASSVTVSGQFTAGTYQGAGLTTCGDGTHAVSWSGGTFGCQTLTGGSGASLSSTQTWTGGNTYQSSSTFNGAVVVSTSLTVNSGSGANLSITENGLTGQVVISTNGAGVTAGHCAMFGSSMSVVDAGAACGTGSGPALASTQTWTGGNTFTGAVNNSTDVYMSTGSAVGFDEYQNGVYVLTSTITWQNGNKQEVTLTANTTLNFIAPDHSGSLILRINTGAGSFTGSFSATSGTVKWSGGTAPTITTAASKNDIIACYYSKQQTTYYCAATQNF